MQQFCSGDPSAFDALFQRHAPAVHAFLTQMVGDRALADDLLQITFLSVVRSRGRFDPPSRVAPWFFAIAANAARDALRRKSRRGEQLTPTGQVPEGEAAVAPAGDPAMRKRIEAALLTLPLEQREVVLLHLVHGWTFEDIAEAMQVSPVTARVRAHRGMKALRGLLSGLERV
jgi:RNA polymerase sigma factor (sigma-70 family)